MTTEVTLRVESSSYEQFMGFIRLYKQVEVVNVTTNRKRIGKGGRPKRTGTPVAKAFIYEGKKRNWRLAMFYEALTALGWIDGNTNQQAFVELFMGGETRQHIVWTGDVATLAELFRRLVNERKLVALPKKHSLWVMVNGHFWFGERNREFGTARLRRAHGSIRCDQELAYVVNILDTEYTMDDIREMIEKRR